VTRDLFRYKISDEDEDSAEVDFPGARHLWRIRQITERIEYGKSKRTIEDRYFVTNRMLKAEKALRLVRLHWGIENGANWTLDVAMKEDHSSPCQRGEALVVISWLRLLAYNLVSIFRSKQPKRHGDKLSWNRAFELLKRVFLMDSHAGCLPKIEQVIQYV
jgi:predicted transposase YbfD/YdcC